MPAIDGWRLKLDFFDLDEIAQIRFDLAEMMESAAEASFEGSLQEPSRQLREYRFRFNLKRGELIRHAPDAAIDQVDRLIRATRPAIEAMEPRESIPEAALGELRTHFKEITMLMGSSIPRPDRWNEMGRHVHFGQVCDFDDIERADWPVAKASL
ncbi:hypothetical protein GGD63_003363 [Bradyrhizobium sp. cir1]|uniref:hypothetical protein n=1 Tax=Bradyrhizobium sp. cir1 TaxID=1445730 RepID=UPI00160668F6|nr:hypothetical protein [Bradyrhizobium sp. cir1]MBB4370568.1 hypothetical protein [Bradyrhizobium sp. cir1]